MYSVEDLLISHGYKLPKTVSTSSSSSVATASAAAAAPYDKRYADCHRETNAENRPGRGALSGYEADRGACVYGSRQALVLAKGYPADSEHQRRKEAGSGNLGDAQPLGDSLATDSGFYDAPSLSYSEQLLSHDERDVSYWRRRGQDFSVLLDYADGRELRASAGSWRPQALVAAGEHRERQQQLWEDLSWLRDPDSAPGQLRVTGERKCQSLGTEEWKPAVGLGRQLSDGEGERWAQEQQHRLRMTEGAPLPRARGKSQSLPRVLSPDGTEHTDMVLSRQGQLDRQRVNSTVFSGPYSRYYYSAAIGRDRWGRGWPSGHVALLPKPRFSRPVKPPSYEIHQQTRGSSETLAADQGLKQKDRPIYYYPRGGELQRQDYFAQHSAIFGVEPPGYIPPPSYKRAPLPRGGPINRNELTNYRWRGEVLQVPVSSEAARWFSRQTGGSWLEHYGDRGAPYRRHVHPGYSEEHLGHVRYLPFDDPRVRHNSGGPGGNSLTDSDKVRNINKEIPCAKVLGQSTNDSAFSPPQGPSVNTDGRKASINDNDSSNRWCNRGISKGSDSVACEQSSGSYPAAFQVRQPPPPPPQSKPVDQGVAETVKKSEPEPEKERPKSIRKKLNETIFCLVSVPAPPAPSGTTRDQNNNDEKPPDQVDSPSENKTGHLTNQSLQSTSSAEAELQALTGSIASSLTSSRASSKVVRRVPCRPPKINHYKELKLSGSWPANQYRDQETQTSPEARKPAPPGPENKEAQEPVPQGSDVAPDSGVGGAAFSYPIKGVKSLKPSSNSAFSRTSTFSSQLNKSTAPTPAPPSGNAEEDEAAKPAAAAVAAASGGGGQEAFGQFLLKPVSRRPWDAIEELETINKELQNQQSSKRPSVDQCIEDLNEAYKDILELGTASNKVSSDSNVQIPERIKIRMSGEPLNKPSSLRRSMDSWSASVDPEYREVKSAFSRPAAKSVTFSKQLREELPVPPRETGFREYRVIPNLSHKRNSDGRTVKLDLPDEPIETPLCDFSPTTHATAAEVPWADRQPMQDASTLTSPPDYEDICQTLRQSRDTTEAKTCRSKPGAGDSDPPQDDRVDSEEECPICRRESESQMRQLPMPPLHEEDCSELTNQNGASEDTGAEQCPASENRAEGGETPERTDLSSNQSEPNVRPDGEEQPSPADENAGGAETAIPTENPNDPREVKFAEGASESESIEERAARILGIDVPAESLVTEEKSASELATGGMESAENETTRHVPESGVDKLTSGEKEELEAPDSQSAGSADRQEQEKKQQAVLEPRIVLRAHLGRDHPGIPEFPPDRLPLSVPLNPDHRLSLSVEGERRSRCPSQRIEALQDKLAASPSRVAVERLARMKEVDSVSRMRRLSIRSTDSGEGEASGGQEEEALPTPLRNKVDDGEVSQTATVSMETVLQDQDKALSVSVSPPLCPRGLRLEPDEESVERPRPSSPLEVLAPTL
ncbi:junctional cadherin 5-associated protein [Osmerus eperlanus]|uniref:junctional cadherin 5-associated protein n=1 Tax=Osmerus eperlanus TaxID=29151 RepID=UPI002E10A6AA